ncbi:MAG: DNA-formamidopyrimidine glycosylase, partial [Candidatus Bipolaricaulota bacterium]|nr:DNA-formamidopyrimidine glycosylase [Candidatus Bipolaricaulota bacterium]
ACAGTTLADGHYRGPNGELGTFSCELGVYGREGEPCRRCGGPIERTVLGGRGTFTCPRCQR